MGQHIICIERTYGNQVIVNSMDKMIDIFGQRHGRKNFFFFNVLKYVFECNIETVDRIRVVRNSFMARANWVLISQIRHQVDPRHEEQNIRLLWQK